MSFIDLKFTGTRSLDIMADSAEAKQVLLSLSSKLDWLKPLYSEVLGLGAWIKTIVARLDERH
jgi:hypothetical protein